MTLSRRIQVLSPGCAGFSVGLNRLSRALLHEIYGIATPLVLTDQEGNELEDGETFENVPNLTELNVFDDLYLDIVEHVHDENTCHFHAHGAQQHCEAQCQVSHILQGRAHLSANRWNAMAQRDYVPLHAWLFQTPLDLNRWLSPALAEALGSGSEERLRALVRTEAADTKLFSLLFFSDEACQCLIEEVEAFEASGLPTSRPNSMNSYGLILDQVGMRDALTELRERVVVPLLRLFYAREVGIDQIDDHHAFIVQYAGTGATSRGDVDLGFHYDESEFTLNVCLGREFTGSRLYFRGLLLKPETHSENLSISHERARGLLHIGKHRHGAEPIESGERFNLIMWLRASSIRHGCHGHGHGHNHDHDHDHDHGHGDDDDDDDDHDHSSH
jgi:hypothetical protein